MVGETVQAAAEGFLVQEEAEMTSQLNAHRVSHSFSSLPTHEGLRLVARRQAQRMIAAGYIYHNPDLAAEAKAALPDWKSLGENVGVGPSVEIVQEAFLASPGHHRNIDTEAFNLLGLGALATDGGRMFFTQTFAQSHNPTLSSDPVVVLEVGGKTQPAAGQPHSVTLPQTLASMFAKAIGKLIP